MKPDYAKLQLKGNGMTDDSVACALQAAGRLFGREADYETLAALLGNAVAPAINPGEDCMSHWMVEGVIATRELPVAASYLGMKAEALPLPNFTGDRGNDADLRNHRLASVPVIAQALRDGAVVLTEDGWDIKGPKGFIHWGLAGIVTRAEDDQICGAHLWGARNHLVKYPTEMWQLRLAGEPRPLKELDPALVKLIVDRIRGRGKYQRTAGTIFGVDAMDAWIKMMSEVPGYCAPCFKRIGVKAGDAANNAQRVANGAEVTGRFLRKLGRQYEPVAKHYDQIVKLLDPVLTGKGGEKYEQFLGDMEKQKAHAETVLKPVKTELAAAADEVERVSMKRVTRNHTVPPQRRYQVREPVATVELGETFVVETINFRTPIVRTPADANPATYREREETGPIFVSGIGAGDVMAVHILDIRPEGHASGGWWRDPKENSFLRIADERVHFPGGYSAKRRST